LDRKSSSAVALLVVASVFYPGGKSSGGAAGQPPPPVNSPSVKGTLSSETGEGPWTPICQHFLRQPEDPKKSVDINITIKGKASGSNVKTEILGNTASQTPAKTLEQLYCLPDQRPRFRAMIATVSDPERTHLSLDFDRDVESIVWAIGDEGYTLENYWFPWQPHPDKEETDPEKRKSAKEDQDGRLGKPGLILFRCSRGLLASQQELLAVFLVGETPTFGPNRLALTSALDGIQVLTGDTTIFMVGPSFSGSLKPLSRMVAESGKGFFIVSGRATSNTEIGDFGKAVKQYPNIQLQSTIENDSFALQRFAGYVSNWGAWPNRQDNDPYVALLSEDETAYGAPPSGESDGKHDGTETAFLRLRFPRGISRLRNSAEELPGVNTPQSKPGPGYQQLPLILKESGRDTIRSFSEQLTPVSNESVLMSLTGTIRRKQIRYAGIMATDPLDVLFLSRFLRATCPDVQLFVMESDQLFVRAAHDYQLEGLLTISNYPLILQNQEYGKKQLPPRRIPFASTYGEATYNACRRVLLNWQNEPMATSCRLCSAENCKAQPRDLMLEYSSPFKIPPPRTKPALWLNVVGHDNFWPVALLDDGTGSSPFPGSGKVDKVPSSLVKGADLADKDSEFGPEKRSLIWYGLLIGIVLFSFLNLISVFLMNWPSLKEGRPQVLRRYDAIRSFSLRLEGNYAAPRAAHIIAMLMVVLSMNALFLYPAGVLRWWERWLFAGTMALLFAEAIWITIICWRMRKGRTGAPLLAGMSWLAGIGAATSLACLAMRDQSVSHVNDFFAYRSIHPESGVSPIAPLLVLAVAIYYWAWIQIRRLRFAEERRPEIPEDSVVAAPKGFQDEIEDVFGKKTTWTSGPFILLFLLLFFPFGRLRTFEGHAYDLFMGAAVAVLYAMLIGNCVRFTLLWKDLRLLLQFLERHPVREAFTRLPSTFSWTSIWRGDLKPNYLTLTRARDCLRRFPLWYPSKKVELCLDHLQREERKEVEQYDHYYYSAWCSLQRIYRTAASCLVAGGLQAAWDKGMSESMINSMRKPDGVTPAAPSTEEEKDLWYAEEFVALRYVEFIRYVLLQMRNFLEFITTGFMLMVFALIAFPFEGHRALNTATLALFAVLGVSVGLVFAQMDRDALLSRLSDTRANKLDFNFVTRLITYGALPLIALLGSQFPSIGNFLFSWLQPALQAMR
jgi:hypothetical protein